ncbi:MAG: SDR family oxidoreductase [Acidimicrobiales bacterium]
MYATQKEMNDLFGSIAPDILINNAGVGRAIDSTVNANPEDLDQTIETNVTAAIHAVRAVTPSMIKNGKGHIVNVGSVAGLYPPPLSSSVYGASKGAIHFLSTNLSLRTRWHRHTCHRDLPWAGTNRIL